MKHYMEAMVKVLDGSDPKALENAGPTGFDPKFVQVYRNNSVSAFADVLRANYPSVLHLIGQEYFAVLANDYIKNYPTNDRTLVGYGKDFYLVIKDYESEHKLPYLKDFAKLDRAWTCAHLAANADTLAITTLAAMAEQGTDLETVKLVFKPSVHLMKLGWPIFDLWIKMRSGQGLDKETTMDEGIEYVMVWRFQNEVSYRRLSPSEFNFLNALSQGRALGVAMNAALTAPPSEVQNDMTRLLPNAIGAEIFKNL